MLKSAKNVRLPWGILPLLGIRDGRFRKNNVATKEGGGGEGGGGSITVIEECGCGLNEDDDEVARSTVRL